MVLTSQKKRKNIPRTGSGGFIRPAEVVEKFDLRKGMIVADFGCGSGYFTILAAKKIGKEGIVHAVDVMDSALDSVRSGAKIYSLFNINTIKGNLEKDGGSGLPDKSVDVVLMANILYQVNDKVAVVEEAKRILKNNGKIIVVEWTSDTPLGPPSNKRVLKEEFKALAKKEDLIIEKEFDAGGSHYGLMFSL